MMSLTSALLIGCSSTPSSCLWVKEIRPEKSDLAGMSRSLKEQIETQDEMLEKQRK